MSIGRNKSALDKIEAYFLENGPSRALALELRLLIEATCYRMVATRATVVTPEELRGWQPGKIIQEVSDEFDSLAFPNVTLSIDLAGDGKMHEIGTQTGLDRRKTVKHYNALGRLLHLEFDSANFQKLAEKIDDFSALTDLGEAREIIGSAIAFLRSEDSGSLIFNKSDLNLLHYDCECGTTNNFSRSAVKSGRIFKCRNKACKCAYIVSDTDQRTLTLLRKEISCPHCRHSNHLDYQDILDIRPFEVPSLVHCANCKETFSLLLSIQTAIERKRTKIKKTRLSTLSILVPDYAAGIDFFCRQLGFDLLEDIDLGGGKRWVRVAPKGAETAFLIARATTPEQVAAIGNQGGGRVWLILETEDFAADHAAMQAQGVTFEEAPRHEPYGTVAVFRDPFGNRWDLIEFA